MTDNCYFSNTYNLSQSLQWNVCFERQKRRETQGRISTIQGRYVWNRILLQPLLDEGVAARWIVPVVHGFVGSTTFSSHGLTISLILISRRSTRYAGTRFLKRGADCTGNVANEVETEQILFDATVSDFGAGSYASFVQLRGSIPVVWSQDQSKTVTKPPVTLDLSDPYAVYSARHFADLQNRYGVPIVVVNLVKKRERRRQESIIGDAFRCSVSYLNTFLPPKDRICYFSFDMARCNKLDNVLSRLEIIGERVAEVNGFFQTYRPYLRRCDKNWAELMSNNEMDIRSFEGSRFILQKGAPRTNCVDCLDRTNAAQLVIAEVLMRHQLSALGVTSSPQAGTPPELANALEKLYELQGDAIAMQYAGSQLVHSVRTYKKSALFQERSRDVIQTLSRYYSSTFSAADKQNGLNLFLGVFKPWAGKTHIWDLSSDFYLHNHSLPDLMPNDYCAWFQQRAILDLDSRIMIPRPRYDAYEVFYEPWSMTSFDSVVSQRQKSVVSLSSPEPTGDKWTAGVASFSRLWKTSITGPSSAATADADNSSVSGESSGVGQDPKNQKNPQAGSSWGKKKSSVDVTSASSGDSDEEEEFHSDIDVTGLSDEPIPRLIRVSPTASVSAAPDGTDASMAPNSALKCICPSSRQVYGFDLEPPSTPAFEKYATYATISAACHSRGSSYSTFYPKSRLIRVHKDPNSDHRSPLCDYTQFFHVVPKVSDRDLQVYVAAINCSVHGPVLPSGTDITKFTEYKTGKCIQPDFRSDPNTAYRALDLLNAV